MLLEAKGLRRVLQAENSMCKGPVARGDMGT